jgi:ABC-type multidrug transport system ATPase subunit
VIEYVDFSKRFGGVAAVRDLNLHVYDGETLALIGPNGSGKTTTLKAAVGLVLPSSGCVRVCGMDVQSRGRDARRMLGYLPQHVSFPAGCSAREAMNLYASLRGQPNAANAVATLLERVGLADDADRAVDGFSGGMRQRLGIGIALLGDPRILILDEPTSSLDPSGALMMRDIIAGISAEGRTVLLSSHDLAEVERLADRVAIFVHGRLAAIGDLRELQVQHAALSLEAIYRGVTDAQRAA